MADTPTIHLTHTGTYAGRPFCTITRAAALAAGHQLAHVPYSNIDWFLAQPHICPECRAEWDAAGDDAAADLLDAANQDAAERASLARVAPLGGDD